MKTILCPRSGLGRIARPGFLAAVLAGALFDVQAAPASLESTLTLPAKPPAPGESFAILATGDGGWAELDRELAHRLHESTLATALPVPPEIARLRGIPLLVVQGEKDDSSSGATLSKDVGRVVRVPGDHHFNRDYDRLAQLILGLIRSP